MEISRAIYMGCLIVASVWVFLVFIGQTYFSYFKIDEILKCLGDSKLVSIRKGFIGSDPFTRMFFVNTVAGMLVFQSLHIKDGAVTREELESVPRLLKFQLRLWAFFLFGFGAYGITLWVLGRCMGWLR